MQNQGQQQTVLDPVSVKPEPGSQSRRTQQLRLPEAFQRYEMLMGSSLQAIIKSWTGQTSGRPPDVDPDKHRGLVKVTDRIWDQEMSRGAWYEGGHDLWSPGQQTSV